MLKEWQAAAGKPPKPWTVRECLDYYLESAATMKPNTFILGWRSNCWKGIPGSGNGDITGTNSCLGISCPCLAFT